MSVVGSLEDLSFPDILQVIHVSRQSGTLVLAGRDGERRVRFRDGRVCGARLGNGGPELEELLLQKGLVDSAALAVARKRSARTGEALPVVLVADGAVSQETIERLVRDELRSILRSLVLLQEGEFRFEMEGGDGALAEPSGIGLSEGLDPDSVLRDLEVRHGGRPARPRKKTSRLGSAATIGANDAAALSRRVIVVLERAVMRRIVREGLEPAGHAMELCDGVDEALGRIATLARRGERLAVVADLLIPGTQSDSLRGGLDLVREARRLSPDAPLILLGDRRGVPVCEEARSAGADLYMPYPDGGDAGLEEFVARLERLRDELVACIGEPRATFQESPGDARSLRVVDQLSLLRGLIGEMSGETRAEVPLLVLRLAAEYFERGVLFTVRGGEACGSGAFAGEESGGESTALDVRMRGAALPLQRGSVLQRAVEERQPYIGPVPSNPANKALLERLGAPAPLEAALLPLLSGRQVYGVLYGDNAGSERPVGDLRALEIFLSQAGIVLENALLQRRIASLGAGGTASGGGAADHG